MAYVRFPSIADSTPEERRALVRERYACIADCDNCGLCVIFPRVDPELALADYIEGRAEHDDVMMRIRRRR